MARYTGPVCRLCRRAGEKLFLKGERCYTPKCAVDRRHKTPGNQVPRRRRLSDWGIQLREKQKARQGYGLLERQFHNYFLIARSQPGPTGPNLLNVWKQDLTMWFIDWGSHQQDSKLASGYYMGTLRLMVKR